MIQPAAVGVVGMLLQLLQLCTKSMVHLVLLMLLLLYSHLLLLLLCGHSSLLLLLLPGQQVCCRICSRLRAERTGVSGAEQQDPYNQLQACFPSTHVEVQRDSVQRRCSAYAVCTC